MINIDVINLGPMDNCTYLVTQGKEALLIDPAWDMNFLIHTIEEKQLHLCGVLFTHGHFDHVKFSQELLTHFGLKAYLQESDVPLAGLPLALLHTYQGDQTFEIGPFHVKIWATPGHTAGCVCIQIEDALFTGDTLFPGACGRVDLPTSNPRDMLASLRKIAAFPEDTRLFAGHSYGGRCSSTVADEKLHNSFMRNALRWEKN